MTLTGHGNLSGALFMKPLFNRCLARRKFFLGIDLVPPSVAG
jgi:hypothetical protein